MVYRLELTYDEIVDILEVKYIAGSTIGYTPPSGIRENSENNSMIKPLLPNKEKVKNTIDDIRLKSKSTTNKTKRYTKKSFLYTMLGFTQSHSSPLGDIGGLIQLISGSYGNDKPVNITGSDKVNLKCDWINGSVVNSIRGSNLFKFALDKLPGFKIYKKQE